MRDKAVVARFAHLYGDRGVLWFPRWQGVLTIQNPMDVWAIADIIYKSRPQV
jgi:cephalosporin hydroxylase